VEKKRRFITAIQTNEGIIYKIAAIYTDSADDRDDLVQEIIFHLWKSFDSFQEHSSLSTWMYRVAMNVAIYPQTNHCSSSLAVRWAIYSFCFSQNGSRNHTTNQLIKQKNCSKI